MRLTTHTDYSLRLLLYLAAAPERRASVAEIAVAFAISRNHLVKVANQLVKLGYVEAVRGHGGGLRLAKPAEQINIGDVVRRTEPDFAIVECFDHKNNECVISAECGLTGVLFDAVRAFQAVLSRHSLADVVQSSDLHSRLVRLRPA